MKSRHEMLMKVAVEMCSGDLKIDKDAPEYQVLDYLMTDEAAFVTKAEEDFGYRGKKGAQKLVKEINGLFAGGELAEEDMDNFLLAVQQAYIDAKKRNKKKYSPKKNSKEES